ncbi:MAG: biotin/lipoyl-binding protein, partial [bacterium]
MEAIGNGIKVAKKKHWFLRTIRLKRTWLIVILLLVGAGITFSILNKKIVTVYTTESVKRGELVQTVTATGNVESAKEIDLSFKIPGQIGAVNIKAGDMVVAGQILASIDNTAYLSQVAQLTAAVAVANANLERVQAGASKEDVKITQEQVVKAQADLANLQIDRDVQLTSLREKSLDTLNNSVFTAKVVLNKIYNYFINRDTTTGLQVSDTDLKNQVLNAYLLRVNDLE